MEKSAVESTTGGSASGIFEIEEEGDTIIVVPTVDLRELEYRWIEMGAREILELLNRTRLKNIILDFGKTDYFGSTSLGLILKLGKTVRGRNGLMAFCNVSDHEKEILKVTNLDHSWPIYSSKTEALAAVNERGELSW